MCGEERTTYGENVHCSRGRLCVVGEVLCGGGSLRVQGRGLHGGEKLCANGGVGVTKVLVWILS
ncbi:hypothetical protein [Bartonella sp. WD16.2]|uniref:hypothetical protein n=1 Tax=Bartonella sp. WD16.2 TaxID=1933904 RepID=UPI0012947EFD|nr:hypothetical protein [Bartonella sp. WD16.2]